MSVIQQKLNQQPVPPRENPRIVSCFNDSKQNQAKVNFNYITPTKEEELNYKMNTAIEKAATI